MNCERNRYLILFINTFIILQSFVPTSVSTKPYCDVPKECTVMEFTQRHVANEEKGLKCLLTSESRLRFNKSAINPSQKECQTLKTDGHLQIYIRPKRQGSIRLKRETIDLKDLFSYFNASKSVLVAFQFFKGFQINLFNDKDDSFSSEQHHNKIAICSYSDLNFYSGEKLLRTCDDFMAATNSTRSIFQLLSKMSDNEISIKLAETKTPICPLVFKDFRIQTLWLFGQNSFYSRSVLWFENSTKIGRLNSNIIHLEINIDNANLDFNFLNPFVFESVKAIYIYGKVKKIDPKLFSTFKNITFLYLKLEYFRNLMHNNGLEWLKNINSDINVDLNNQTEIAENIQKRLKYIYHDCVKFPSLDEVFPDEDFCLYADFPLSQFILVLKSRVELTHFGNNFSCTYLWITRLYELIIPAFPPGTNIHEILINLLESDEYKSINRCRFADRINLCNRSTFKAKHIKTIYELGEEMILTEAVINILSYVMCVFGLVTNILIIVTISSKSNTAEFKEFKQYDYLRLNSICNCAILAIHLASWLNKCVYPFQVFCPVIRKLVFFQYFKIVVGEMLMSALQFMTNFTYLAFAFNRISLIGKEHNKLVKFMSDVALWKYVAVSLFVSILMSVGKFFEYDINQGLTTFTYPISYDYFSSVLSSPPNPALFIVNFISDVLNHFVLLLLNAAVDVGMIVKLRRTLREKFEKAKVYSTLEQQEKRISDNESVVNNVIAMVILNTTFNVALKLPTASYSFIYLFYSISRLLPPLASSASFVSFFNRFCIGASFCDMLFQLAGFLYLLSISVPFFFYKHYDKKFNVAFRRRFCGGDSEKKKSIQMGLLSYFNMVNLVSSSPTTASTQNSVVENT